MSTTISKGTELYNRPEVRQKIAQLEAQRDMKHVRAIDKLIDIALIKTEERLELLSPARRLAAQPAIYHEEMDKLKRERGLIA
jgi:hypothetical protein